jgi:hypothetical protein
MSGSRSLSVITLDLDASKGGQSNVTSRSASEGERGMSIWARLADAAAGLADNAHIASPVRGLLGVFAGGHSSHRDSDRRAQHQVAFTIGVIALGAKMARSKRKDLPSVTQI